MSSNKRKFNISDESTASSSTQYSLRSFSTAATSPPRGPDPEDSGWFATTRTYPIVAADAIVEPWIEGGLRGAVMGAIRTLNNWVSVDVFRRGVSHNAAECPPTIVVVIGPGTLDEGCKAVAEQVKAHIERYNLDAAVEFIEGTVERYKVLDDIEESVKMGASVALADPKAGTGTLGGFVRLENPKIGHVFKNGLRPGCLKASEGLVESPSKEDIDESIQAWISYLHDQQERLNGTREKIEIGIASNARIRCQKGEINAVEETKEKVRGLENLDRQLGRVLASSGFKVASTGCGLDWGLVEVNEERVAGNLLKPIPPYFQPMSDRVGGTCELDKGARVYKSGRNTGFTEGCWSHLQSAVHLPDSPQETAEDVFLATGRRGACFANNGDSGAWVLNKKGQLGGLVIGGNPLLNWVYVTPISAVFADIESQIGCKISLPTAE